MEINSGLRTSTNSGIAGVASFAAIWALSYWAPDFLAASPANPEITGSMITGGIMWAVARISRSPVVLPGQKLNKL